MAIRSVFKSENAALHKICKPVEAFDKRLGDLLDDLKDTLHGIGGLGLAAPQVGVLRRVCIVEYENEFYELVNPVIVETSKEQVVDNEGCLSVSGFRGLVRRSRFCTVEYYDREGIKRRVTASDYKARVFMHEIDHLDGILFSDKMIKRIANKK